MTALLREHSVDELFTELQAALPGRVCAHADIARVVRWKIGGRARIFVDPYSSQDVAAVYRIMAGRPESLMVVGDASNLLFDSAGFEGVIMRIGRRMASVRRDGLKVFAQAGIWIPQLARFTANMGLSGLEHTVGIPGTLGGLISMNGGSQRKGIGLVVKKVDCVARDGRSFSLSHEECNFNYRSSSLQNMDATIVAAELELADRSSSEIRCEMINILISRKSRFPKSLPNGGSTFLSDPAMYASVGPPGKIIESLGLKGVSRGGAQISPQHANFIVNTGGATSDDVLWLIHLIRTKVFEATNYWMACEVRFISADGQNRPAHLAADEYFNN